MISFVTEKLMCNALHEEFSTNRLLDLQELGAKQCKLSSITSEPMLQSFLLQNSALLIHVVSCLCQLQKQPWALQWLPSLKDLWLCLNPKVFKLIFFQPVLGNNVHVMHRQLTNPLWRKLMWKWRERKIMETEKTVKYFY